MSDITINHKGIPLDNLIDDALAAAYASQYDLVSKTGAGVNQTGFEVEGDDSVTRNLELDLERSIAVDTGAIKNHPVSIKAPFMGIVPVPAVWFGSVETNFSMVVNGSTTSKTEVKTAAMLECKAKWGHCWPR